MELLLLALGAFWGWEFLRGILPFPLPARLAPLAVAGIAYGLTFITPVALLAVAAAGGVALLRKAAGPNTLEPWSLPWADISMIARPPRRGPGRVRPGAQGRAPAPKIGNRLPRL